jgi:betaine-aldehyde dehydrogenase
LTTITDGTAVTYGHVINGEIVDPGGDHIERHDPATGALISVYAAGGQQEINTAVSAARAAFDAGTWSDLDGMARFRTLMRLAELVREQRDEFARLDAAEVGKPLRVAEDDVDGAIGQIEFAASLAAGHHGDVHTNLDSDFTGLHIREPIGVVGVIVPWNFPLLILCQKAAYALAAGCTIVVKPSEYTSASALLLAKLAIKADLPRGVFNVVTGDGRAGQALAQHLDVDMLTFTGSTSTGRRVLEASKGNLKRTSLELGGKAAQIVFADADLDDAVEGVLFGATHNQGECCVAGARLLVQDSVSEEFIRRLTERAADIRVGAGTSDADFGALIHDAHLQHVLSAVESAKSEGGTIVTGGERLTGPGYDGGAFMGPTIVADVLPSMEIFHHEVFGPVLTVSTFSEASEAIELANAVEYGLGNTVWTKDIDTALTVTRKLRSGTVWINTSIDGAPQLSFGGYKASGYGREMGRLGLEEFCQTKTVQIRTGKRAGTFGLRG